MNSDYRGFAIRYTTCLILALCLLIAPPIHAKSKAGIRGGASAAKNYQGSAFGLALGFAIEGKIDRYINGGFALDGFSINGKGMSATFWGAAFTMKPEIRLKGNRVALLPGIGLGLGSANENGSSKITPYGRAQIDVVISIPNKPAQIVFDAGIMAFDGGFNSASPIAFFRVGFLK